MARPRQERTQGPKSRFFMVSPEGITICDTADELKAAVARSPRDDYQVYKGKEVSVKRVVVVKVGKL